MSGEIVFKGSKVSLHGDVGDGYGDGEAVALLQLVINWKLALLYFLFQLRYSSRHLVAPMNPVLISGGACIWLLNGAVEGCVLRWR